MCVTQQFSDALNELLTGSGMSAKELARRIEVDPAQVGRWRKARGLPRPDNIIRVASVFGVDYDWLLGLAYPEVRSEGGEPDVIETAIRARMAEMREAVRDTPREFWSTIIKKTFDTAIDGARNMASMLSASDSDEPTVRRQTPSRISKPIAPTNLGQDDSHEPLAQRKLGAPQLVGTF